MGSRERREREKGELREKILDAARELFATEGFEATTMRRIADRIEYSPTAIYLHFPDKDTLLREICANDFAQMAEAFAGLIKIKDPIQRLCELGRTYAEMGVARPHAYRLMFMTPKIHEGDSLIDGKDIGNPEQDSYAFLLMTVQAAIDAGALKDEFRDAGLVAQTVWAGIHGVVSQALVAKLHDPYHWKPYKQRVDVMLGLLIGGIAKPGTVIAGRKRAGKKS